MSKIKKIDEMAVLKTRIHTKRRAAKYVLTDMWIQDDPSTDGYYPHIKNRVGDDLKKLVKKVLEEDFRVDFYEDGLAARIVKLLPDDMFREGWDYSFPKLDDIAAANIAEQYAAVMEELGAQQKIKDAMTWKRLYGGAAILISAMDGLTPDQPLDPKRIRSIERLRVIERTEIEFENIIWQDDPTKPRYGLPEVYPVRFDTPGNWASQTMLVHHSRIIELHGDTLPRHSVTGVSAESRYWGIPALQRANDRLKSLGMSLGSIDQLLSELGVGKYKIKDLATLLATPEGEAAIKRRVELTDLVKSTFRSMYMDNEEDYVRDTISFAGVPEILHILFMLISADTGYPMTRLFGMSPAGMNATGESDLRNYYDMISQMQERLLRPALERLLPVLAVSCWGFVPEDHIVGRPVVIWLSTDRGNKFPKNIRWGRFFKFV